MVLSQVTIKKMKGKSFKFFYQGFDNKRKLPKHIKKRELKPNLKKNQTSLASCYQIDFEVDFEEEDDFDYWRTVDMYKNRMTRKKCRRECRFYKVKHISRHNKHCCSHYSCCLSGRKKCIIKKYLKPKKFRKRKRTSRIRYDTKRLQRHCWEAMRQHEAARRKDGNCSDEKAEESMLKVSITTHTAWIFDPTAREEIIRDIFQTSAEDTASKENREEVNDMVTMAARPVANGENRKAESSRSGGSNPQEMVGASKVEKDHTVVIAKRDALAYNCAAQNPHKRKKKRIVMGSAKVNNFGTTPEAMPNKMVGPPSSTQGMPNSYEVRSIVATRAVMVSSSKSTRMKTNTPDTKTRTFPSQYHKKAARPKKVETTTGATPGEKKKSCNTTTKNKPSYNLPMLPQSSRELSKKMMDNSVTSLTAATTTKTGTQLKKSLSMTREPELVKSKEVRADSVARGFRKKKKNFQVRKAIPERSAHISTSPSLTVARSTTDRETSQLRKELTVPDRDNEDCPIKKLLNSTITMETGATATGMAFHSSDAASAGAAAGLTGTKHQRTELKLEPSKRNIKKIILKVTKAKKLSPQTDIPNEIMFDLSRVNPYSKRYFEVEEWALLTCPHCKLTESSYLQCCIDLKTQIIFNRINVACGVCSSWMNSQFSPEAIEKMALSSVNKFFMNRN